MSLRGVQLPTFCRASCPTQLPHSLHDVIVEQKKLSYTTPGISISRMGEQINQLSISAQPAPGVAPSVLIEALSGYVNGLSTVEFFRAQHRKDQDAYRGFAHKRRR